MKIPATPQYTDQDIRNALDLAHDRVVLDAVFKKNTRYLHWEEVRRRKYPVDPLYIWVLMKIFRLKDAHNLSFADWTFSYSLDDSCWRKLHLLDKTGAGNLSSILDAVGQERERYIISSLMEEAIASSQLEGAATTRRVAKQMLREQRKPRTRGERMIVNNYLTMKEVRTLKTEDLSPELILKLHAMITAGTLDDPDDEGRFRNNDDTCVVDGSGTVLHTPPPYKDIPGYMRELCRFANAKQNFTLLFSLILTIVLHM